MVNINRIYLWKEKSIYKYPWQRQFLNIDFLKYEQKRIRDVSKWYDNFQRLKTGDSLNEVYYYITPLELESRWKVAINSKENYNYVGLSALNNCLQVQLLMLLPKDKPIPKDYSFIRIVKSKKDYIHDEKNNDSQYVINVEEFEEVDSSYVYVDVPYEKRSISKFIKENLVNDDFIANSFQPTISGSPYVVNDKGGISLSSFQEKNSFSEELITTLKLMQPLEFTDLQYELPERLKKGKVEHPIKGFKFNVAEKRIRSNNFFTAFSSNDYGKLDHELIKRRNHIGEYSIVCSLIPRGDNVSELSRDIFSKFIKTEITQPFNIDKEWDIDLNLTQKKIDEDLWLQVVNQKQTKPTNIKEEKQLSDLRKNINNEWEIVLDTLGLKNTEHEIKYYTQGSFNNIMNVAQSIARDEQKKEVNESILSKSFKLFKENAQGLAENPKFQTLTKNIIPQRIEDAKFNAIRGVIQLDVMNIKDLFNNVKDYFKDMYELQDYIDKKLLLGGFIYEPKIGSYKWI